MSFLRYVKFFVYISLLIAVSVFSFVNSDTVNISYMYGDFQLPLALALIVFFFLGVLSLAPFYFWNNLVLTRRVKSLKKQLDMQSDFRTSNIIIK